MQDDIRNSLPREIIDVILSVMDTRTKRIIRSASKYWHRYVQFDEFKVHFACAATLPAIVQHFTETYPNKPIGLSFEKIIFGKKKPKEFPVHHLASMTQLTSLHFSEIRLTDADTAEKLTSLTNLLRISTMPVTDKLTNLTSLGHVASYDLDILTLYTNLRDLYFTTRSPIDNPFALVANPSRLTSIYLSADRIELTQNDGKVMAQLSNLKKLEILLFQTALPRFFQYLTSLEHLVFWRGIPQDDLFLLTRVTYLETHSMTVFNSTNRLTLPSIKQLVLNHMEEDRTFLTALTALENLRMRCDGDYTNEALQFITSRRLTRLEVQNVNDGFNVEHLSNLTTLMNLQIESSAVDAIPKDYSVLKCLTNLEDVSIVTTGTAPFMEVAQLTRLTKLDVRVKGEWQGYTNNAPVSLQNLVNLQAFIFFGALSQSVYDSMVHLTNLTTFKASLDVEVFESNPNALANLPLKILYFDKQICSPHVWSLVTRLTDLEHLCVWRVDSEEVIESFSVLTNLTSLCMKRSHSVSGIHLTKLTSLQSLVISSKKAKKTIGLAKSTGLKVLTRLRDKSFQ